MQYKKIVEGAFLERLNRFVALVEIQGKRERVHVKNTGRCRELLIPGVTVYLEDHEDSLGNRKTRWDLIAVEKVGSGEEESMLVNMDSQASNRVVEEALRQGRIELPGFLEPLSQIRPETVFGSSRFDFYVEGTGEGGSVGGTVAGRYRGEDEGKARQKGAFIEVKGVTLEEHGIARFPDAPTERGVRHIRELCQARNQGYLAYVIFVIQMKPVRWLEPNDDTHPAFGEALRQAESQGVSVLAFDCRVERDGLRLDLPVPVRLK